ncbi:MAG: hypothetical protein ACR2ND_14725 [Solirubrobacteraceae bacterium]
MPDVDGNEQGEATETPLHAYKEGREDEMEPGTRGADGNTPPPEPGSEEEGGSYHEGGHPAETEHAAATKAPAEAGSVEDDSSGGYGGAGEAERSPDRSASADAQDSPRGTDRAN